MPDEKKINRPHMTDAECQKAVDRVLNRLDEIQQFDKYATVNSQQIRDLLNPDGMWSFSWHG
jgi:hypothetical protein